MRTGKIVSIDSLMLSDASNIESDTGGISDSDFQDIIPTGSSLSDIKSKLAAGEVVLLSDSPRSPLFTSYEGEWVTSVSASADFPKNTITAINQRFSSAGSSALFERTPFESLPPSAPLDYIPDTTRVKEGKVIPLSCQYNIEMACTPNMLSKLGYGYFSLAKTANEISLAVTTVTPLGQHTLLSAVGKFDEPKQLQHVLMTGRSSQLSVKPVSMVPLGSKTVNESFIPVQLAIQVNDKLGFPSRGYFYHFKQGKLVHEYGIIADTKGYVHITHSTENGLSDDVYIPTHRNCIFLPWKVKGQTVTPQHLYYSKEKLTSEVFNSIDITWLEANAFTVDLKAILAANSQPILARDTAQTPSAPRRPTTPQHHRVLVTHEGAKRESWLAIAKQYELTPNELLALNPSYQQDPMKLNAGDMLNIAKKQAITAPVKIDTKPAQLPQTVSRPENVHYQSSTPELAPHVIAIDKRFVLKEVAVLNLGKAETDIDDVYLFFSDKKMDLYEFADEVYGSRDKAIIDHVMNSNPQLRKSFSQIHEGMPLVVSPWKIKHEEEDNAIAQAEELMTQYLSLSVDERQWFADNHDVVAEVLATAAEGGIGSLQVNADTGESVDIDLNTMIASTGAVLAGAGTQGDHISKKLKAFAAYSDYISSKTAGLTGQALYSNADYKDWRKRERAFRGEMKALLGQMGKPKYIKGLQAKNIGHLLNINKRQIYRSKDFANAVGGIKMVPLYKQAMSFSKQIKVGGWIVTGLGMYGNAADIYQTCDMNGIISEACGRSTVRNLTSGAVNVSVGYALGFALTLAPVTGGLSIILVSAGTLAWGMYGGDKSNAAGDWFEHVVFD